MTVDEEVMEQEDELVLDDVGKVDAVNEAVTVGVGEGDHADGVSVWVAVRDDVALREAVLEGVFVIVEVAVTADERVDDVVRVPE